MLYCVQLAEKIVQRAKCGMVSEVSVEATITSHIIMSLHKWHALSNYHELRDANNWHHLAMTSVSLHKRHELSNFHEL